MTLTTNGEALKVRALRSLSRLPPFSPILNRLIASLAHEDVSFVHVAELIEKDTVLAGNVLRMVNSAFYGRGARVNSVRHAVCILGINKLRNGILGMSVLNIWNKVNTPKDFSIARFNMHSVGTALLADLLAQSGKVEYPEGAFAAGLFHDLGRLLIVIGLPEENRQVALLKPGNHFSREECEQEVFDFTHAEISGDALVKWNLPEPICTAVRFHHNPGLAPSPADGTIGLSRIVGHADQYVNAMGYAIASPDDLAVGDSVKEKAIEKLEALELGEPLGPMLETFEAEFETMRKMF